MSILHRWWSNLYRGTAAEHAIEPALAALGVPYRTQFPLFLWGTQFFPDFALPTIGVILEVDDESHEDEDKKTADQVRSRALEKLGYVVVRCSNEEALRDPEGAVRRLVAPLLSRKGPGLPPPPIRRWRKKKKKKSS